MESMTGFGNAEGVTSMGPLSVEVRSVNHRFCDITLKLPRKLNLLEARIKDLIRVRFSRGRIDMSLRLDSGEKNAYRLKPDLEQAGQYLDALRTLKRNLKLKGEISLDMIAQAKDVIVPVEDEEGVEAYWGEVKEIIERSLDGLKEMRRHEGEGLAKDLLGRLHAVRNLLEKIKTRAPSVVEDYRSRLSQRLREMLNGADVDPLRLNQEIAFFAERSDISEETVRMASHLEQLEQMTHFQEPVGRRLEFLLQEVHREANTISSKANDQVISQMVVEIKGELERIREQTQNIE
ncbi:MAG: YicC family protein [Proteobacteria bacterium]|nr:YicC family protein [Pseudomonadota bacterium]